MNGKLGNTNEGDGWKFRGRGFIQLTGRNNYVAFTNFVHEDCVKNPDLLAEKYPFEGGYWFFNNLRIFDICKNDISDATITKMSKLVNGGTVGLKDRIARTKFYYAEIKKSIQ